MKFKLALNSVIYVVATLVITAVIYARHDNQTQTESKCGQEQLIECIAQ
jgi:hypothetical protein